MIKDVLDVFIEKLKTIPELRYVAEDMGQLDSPGLFPGLEFPCVLVDLDKIEYRDRSKRVQEGTGLFAVRLAEENPGATDSTDFYSLAEKVYIALQGLCGDSFWGTTRLQTVKVNRNEQWKELLHLFQFGLIDTAAVPEKRTVSVTPVIEIG